MILPYSNVHMTWTLQAQWTNIGSIWASVLNLRPQRLERGRLSTVAVQGEKEALERSSAKTRKERQKVQGISGNDRASITMVTAVVWGGRVTSFSLWGLWIPRSARLVWDKGQTYFPQQHPATLSSIIMPCRCQIKLTALFHATHIFLVSL